MAHYDKCRLWIMIGAMLLIFPMLYFQGGVMKKAEGQEAQCTRVMVRVLEIQVFDDEDTFTVSDDWHLELWVYDDNAVTHPTVVGGGFGGNVEYIESFRIEGNHDVFRNNVGPFNVDPSSGFGFRAVIPNRATINVPQGSGINIFFQGFEEDLVPGWPVLIKDGVGIVSIRHDRSQNLGIGDHFDERSNTGGYEIDYRVSCLNHAPRANAGGPYSGIMGFAVPFDASQSYDPDGPSISSFQWDFGDGTVGAGVKPIHTYNQEGTYQVILALTDNYGETSTSSTNVTVQREAPTDFTVKCQQDVLAIFAGGESRQIPCTVASLNGFSGAVNLSCESPTNPGITCNFSPSQVTPPANGSIDSTLTVGADFQSLLGTHDLKIIGTSVGTTFTTIMRLHVDPL
jgi:PKD domain